MLKLSLTTLIALCAIACQGPATAPTKAIVTTYSPASDAATAGMTEVAGAHDSTARARIAATYFTTKNELGISPSTRAILTKLMETNDPNVASDFALAAVEKYAPSAIAKACDTSIAEIKTLAASSDDGTKVVADHCHARVRDDANVGSVVVSLVVRQELHDHGETAPAAYQLADAIAGYLPL